MRDGNPENEPKCNAPVVGKEASFIRLVITMKMTCEEVQKNLKDYAEKRLSAPMMCQIEQHVFDCYDCLLCYVGEVQWEPDARKIPA